MAADDPDSTARVQIFQGPERGFVWSRHPLPSALAPGEVLVKLRLATICGSDLHTVRGLRPERTPAVLGHEGVGTVIAMGDNGQRRQLSEGDRVTWSIADSCGRCVFCTTYGLPEKCQSVYRGRGSRGGRRAAPPSRPLDPRLVRCRCQFRTSRRSG